jgi:beta-lactamase class A
MAPVLHFVGRMVRGRLRLLLPLVGAWLAVAVAFASGPDLSRLQDEIDRIISRSRGTIGVSLIHVESGATLSVRGAERFPMASVYKLPIAIELLTQVAAGRLALDRPIALAPSDIRACCTLSRRHPRGGVTITAGELLELMIVESDNTASDAILKLVGGPPVVQRRMRTLGFDKINVNRSEGDINFEMTGVAHPPPEAEWTLNLQYQLISEVTPQALRDARARYTTIDPRDTSTPDDMARLLGRLQLGNLLPPPYTTLLLDLMARARTGPRRLKALLPHDTIVAHKTGTTDVVINDVGIITLPTDSAIAGHLALAVFVINGAHASSMQQTIAQIAGASYEFFTGQPLPVPQKAAKRQGRGAVNARGSDRSTNHDVARRDAPVRQRVKRASASKRIGGS